MSGESKGSSRTCSTEASSPRDVSYDPLPRDSSEPEPGMSDPALPWPASEPLLDPLSVPDEPLEVDGDAPAIPVTPAAASCTWRCASSPPREKASRTLL